MMMMKQIFLTCIFWILIVIAKGQTPERFSFQGVARNSNGQTLGNGSAIAVKFTIRKDAANGQEVYRETFAATVGQGGVFNLAIGSGTAEFGTFEAIDWPAGKLYLQVAVDIAGGNNYVDLGTTQLISVPYAMHARTSEKWIDNDPVVNTGAVDFGASLATVGTGSRLIWYPNKAAFRAGFVGGGRWENQNIGKFSFAGGANTLATGLCGVALGNETIAGGANSVALGINTVAFGEATVALGVNTTAKAYGGTVIGLYNNFIDDPSVTSVGSAGTDRIFQIGNGTAQARSNALTILRNGNVGIGNNVLNPGLMLEVGGRGRIHHNQATAGIYFDNSQHVPTGFVGMQNDQSVGLYNTKWVLSAFPNSVDVDGDMSIQKDLFVVGAVHEGSDRRYKKNIVGVENSLAGLLKTRGYHYNWIDEKKDKGLQTGVIAQEVEEIFPELVKTDGKGFKSVNYVGFIPHLIESVKELKKENDQLKADYAELKNRTGKRLEALEARLDSLVPVVRPDETKTK
jgi:hypothetical protein